MVKDIAISAGGCEFDSWAIQFEQSRQRLVTAALFLWSCVGKALSRKDEPSTPNTRHGQTTARGPNPWPTGPFILARRHFTQT